MKTIEPDILVSALAEALETMAFIAVEPVPDDAPRGGVLHVALCFSGPVAGQLSLSAPPALGSAIAANLAALEPQSVSAGQAADALCELANVTAGLLLRQMCADHEMPQLKIPVVSATGGEIGPHNCCLASLSADGHPVTISLRTHA